MHLMEWCQVLWLLELVTAGYVENQTQDLEYSQVSTEDQDQYHGERNYHNDAAAAVTHPGETSEEQVPRAHRYGAKEVDHQQMNDIRDVLKDILAAQGIEKFFASSTFITTLTNTVRTVVPSVTETMLEEFLTTFVNEGEPTRSSHKMLQPTHSSLGENDDEDILMPRINTDSRRWWMPGMPTWPPNWTPPPWNWPGYNYIPGFNYIFGITTPTTEDPASTTTTSSTEWGGCVTRRRRTTTTPSTTPALDIDALLAIIANLTYDYDTNFTRLLDESLKQFSIPTCATPSTPGTTAMPDYSLYNATVMGKCFVCGLEQHGVPVNAYCADAFAGDFIPLVPVDPKAKGQVSRYRKYCRYRDVNNYVLNESLPRSIFGRWTGGCSVRWIDLSGIYTQRTCRNRHRAVLGRHYGSKRMAKLEMALQHMDNGCIISPMATLVPLSRGISLYARFHACVCTGSWCNWAARTQPYAAPLLSLLLTILLT